MKEDEFIKLFNYMQRIDQKIDKLADNSINKSDHDRVLEILDEITETIEIFDSERVAQNSQQNRVDAAVDDHEERIVRLEK